MRRFRVLLPITVGGRTYQFGDIADLEMDVAIEYAHALIAVEEGEEHGGNY